MAKSEDIPSKKSPLQKIFGLNLSIHAREARGEPVLPYAALRAARTSIGEMPLSLILEPGVGLEPTVYGLQNRCFTN